MPIWNSVSGLIRDLSGRPPVRRPGGRKHPRATLTLEVLESRVCLSLLISSNRTNEILSYDETTGAYQGVFASGGGLLNPGGLAIGPDGNLYVSSNGTNNVLRYDGTTGAFIDVFTSGGDLAKPSGLIFGPDGNLYVNSHSNDSVQRFDGVTGQYIDTFVPSGSGGLSGPSEGLKFGPDGNLYVNSTGTDDVRRFNGQTGEFMEVFTQGGDLMHPSYLLFGPDGNLYVGSHVISRIMRYEGLTGQFIDPFVPDSSGGLRNPTNFQFGPDGNLYVNSRGTQNVLRFDGVTGDFIDEFIPAGGELNAPSGMLFTSEASRSGSDAAHGRTGSVAASGKTRFALLDPASAQAFPSRAGTINEVRPDGVSFTPPQGPAQSARSEGQSALAAYEDNRMSSAVPEITFPVVWTGEMSFGDSLEALSAAQLDLLFGGSQDPR